MPVLAGLGILKQIRKEGYETPVVIMTGHGDLNNSIEALRLGIFDFLVKPFRFQQLSAILTRLSLIKIPAQEWMDFLPFYKEKIQITIPSQTKFNAKVIHRLCGILNSIYQLYRISPMQWALCLGEALNNAIIHGNLEVPSSLKEESWDDFQEMVEQREAQPEYGGKSVTLTCQLTHQRLEIAVQDQGKGFNPQELPGPTDPENLLSTTGRGVFLIRMFMDEVTWNESGNCIHMVKYLQTSQENSV